MRDLDALRDGLERLARGAMGANPYGDRRTEAQARSAGLEALIASLPVDIDNLAPILDLTVGSPTEGQPFAMIGFSVVGGPDTIT